MLRKVKPLFQKRGGGEVEQSGKDRVHDSDAQNQNVHRGKDCLKTTHGIYPRVERRIEAGVEEYLHHRAGDKGDEDAEGEVCKNAEEHLMIGEALPNSHCEIEHQAAKAGQQEHQHNKLNYVADDIACADHGDKIARALCKAGYGGLVKHKGGADQTQQKDGDEKHERRDDKPHERNYQLCPHQRVHADGQGEHQIPLTAEQIFIKALNHHNNAHCTDGKDAERKADNYKHGECIYDSAGAVIVEHHCGIPGHCTQQQHRCHERKHNAPCRAKLVFYKFA